jgi:hypothetical protein
MFFLQKRKKTLRAIASFLLLNFVLEILVPPVAFALTGGPSQPEVESFSPVGTSEMVDMTSGDFTYNIPLLDVGGYPINLTYNAGITPDQEASWVGMGWNINPGVVNRNVRGLPDDFKGDQVTKELNIKDNKTYGGSLGVKLELFSRDKQKKTGTSPTLTLSLGVKYNNYTGYSADLSLSPSLAIGGSSGPGLNIGLGLSASSQNGAEISPNVSFSYKMNEGTKMNTDLSIGVGVSANTREGLSTLTIDPSVSISENVDKEAKKEKKENSAGTGYNFGSTISIGAPTHTPYSDNSFKTESYAIKATIGGLIKWAHPAGTLSGHYSKNKLVNTTVTSPAYGYLYSQDGNSPVSLHDFNREKDGPVQTSTPNVGLANYTFDIYGLSGQGIGGVFRPYRTDIGMLHDPYVQNGYSRAFSIGVEVGVGSYFKIGADVAKVKSTSNAGGWFSDNGLYSAVSFRGKSYMKAAGEKTVDANSDFFNAIGGFDAVRPSIFADKEISKVYSGLVTSDGTNKTIADNLLRSNRQPVTQSVLMLTQQEAASYGNMRTIENYNVNDFDRNLNTQNMNYDLPNEGANRIDRSTYPGHHIGEIISTRPDGARYIYSIPAYNNAQKEVTFSIGDNKTPNYSTGLVEYDPTANDNNTGNKKGQENYFESISTPRFAHSYLLTAIVSADYIDRTGDGPTDDDNGSYTRINYSKAVGEFNWRTPASAEVNRASHNEGFKSNHYSEDAVSDDKANYIYGKKELWYVHSIETRTHIAEFVLENRDDAQGVIDENGGISQDISKSPKRLVKIRLYAKTQTYAKFNTSSLISRLPIKEVNFVYDYSICKGVPNNNNKGASGALDAINYKNSTLSETTGKLTLKEVYFTYGASGKGKYSSYKFHYAGTRPVGVENPELTSMNTYNMKDYDRWGNYKPNMGGPDDNPNVLTSAEFPYAEQDKTKADLYATLWNMTRIELPSGGAIDVEYEADDYAYVQDRNAMQMFKVAGVASTTAVSGGVSLSEMSTDRLINSDKSPNNLVIFKLAQPITAATLPEAEGIFKRDYLKELKHMYFRFFVRIGKEAEPNKPESYEFVPGYIERLSSGLVNLEAGETAYTHAWIELKPVGVRMKGGGGDTNPISRAAWQFAQLYIPRIAYSGNDPIDTEASGVLQILEALVDAMGSIKEAFKGINKIMRDDNKGVYFKKEKSWIRLYNPNGKKIGGGHRVKRVQLTDSWAEMSGQQVNNALYGQTYEYAMEQDLGNDEKRMISSGVTSYEPMLGGDENPFREPVLFSSPDKFLAPRRDYYMEKPFGESFFPSPSVVYSQVKVSSIQSGTGYIVHEHYTSKDFPTLAYHTFLDSDSRVRGKPSSLAKLLKIKNYDYLTISQGYCIVLNDMHGKPKGQTVYGQNSKPISSVRYVYKEKMAEVKHKIKSVPNATPIEFTAHLKRLDNEVDVVYKNSSGNGRIQKGTIGIDYDIAYDSRESSGKVTSSTLQANLDTSPPVDPPAIPLPLVLPIPGLQKEKTRFRSAVITKVINQYGILDETIATEDGASVSTKNLLYDAETGEVLLTSTRNQFNDLVYSFTYPAHWAYNGMGPAYKNIGFETTSIDQNYLMFIPGDELALTANGNAVKGWVLGASSSGVQVIDISGNPITGISYAKVIRSGRRNMQTVPVGTVVTLQDPVVSSELVFTNVLNAGAVEFDDAWKGACDNGFDPDQQVFNPFIEGTRGNWRVKRSYVHLTQRTQSTDNNNTNIRKDGVFESFTPFWVAPQGTGTGDWTKDDHNWQYTSEVTKYSPLGYELENRDALNRYSAALYGYQGGALPIGVANNAKYGEIAFENFDDYYAYVSSIRSKHLRIKSGYGFESSGSGRLGKDVFHSGKTSLRVFPGKTFIYENVIISCE